MRVFRERVFRCEHPDGGVFYLLPAKGDELKELAEFVTTEYVTHDGQLVYNVKTGMPVAKTRQNVDAVIDRAIRKVKSIEAINEQLDDGTSVPMASTQENIEFLVRSYIGTTEAEVRIPVENPKEGEPTHRIEKRAVPQPLYVWIAEEVRRVTDLLREEQRKNS